MISNQLESIFNDNSLELNWGYYLARPFSLFGCSIWDYWYRSKQMKDILGHNMEDSLFIEAQKSFVVNYRIKEQLDIFNRSMMDLARDKDKIKLILTQGEEFNKLAFEKLNNKKLSSLEEEVDFLTSVAIYAGVIPHWVFNYFTDADRQDSELLLLGEKLRSISLYPRLIKEVVNPLASEKIIKYGSKDFFGDSELITLSELLSNKVDIIIDRQKKVKENFFFIYQNRAGNELVEWGNDQGGLISRIEKNQDDLQEIKGSVAFAGKITGFARLILTNDYKDKKFDNGDILIAASTNPTLTPIIQKAGGIVTDEGGIMCHASIISRELKKPCIIGTKKATSIIHDGDLIEVDANHGVIRIIKKAK